MNPMFIPPLMAIGISLIIVGLILRDGALHSIRRMEQLIEFFDQDLRYSDPCLEHLKLYKRRLKVATVLIILGGLIVVGPWLFLLKGV